MQANRRPLATRTLLVLGMLLTAVWTAGPATPAAVAAAGQLAPSHPLQGIEAAVPRERLPVLRAPLARPGPGGRPGPVLLGLVVAGLAAAGAVLAAGLVRLRPARARSLLPSTPRGARGPPLLQPA